MSREHISVRIWSSSWKHTLAFVLHRVGWHCIPDNTILIIQLALSLFSYSLHARLVCVKFVDIFLTPRLFVFKSFRPQVNTIPYHPTNPDRNKLQSAGWTTVSFQPWSTFIFSKCWRTGYKLEFPKQTVFPSEKVLNRNHNWSKLERNSQWSLVHPMEPSVV